MAARPAPVILRPVGKNPATDREVVISSGPFTIGRALENDLTLHARDVSGRHAQIIEDPVTGMWQIEDLNSTNGSFINGKRVTGTAPLTAGATLNLASCMFRVASAVSESAEDMTVAIVSTTDIQARVNVIDIIEQQLTYPHFQPIYESRSRRPVAWEALGRASGPEGPLSPGRMFYLAELAGLEDALSLCFRQSAIHCVDCGHCWDTGPLPMIFINLHPAEIAAEALEESLRMLASQAEQGKYTAVIEAPESWVSRTDEMRVLVQQIRDAGMKVAYDDFGAGQSRLHDLVSVPPDFLKFDRDLITDLHREPVKWKLVEAVVEACRELDVMTLAEGIETEEELQACESMGIDLLQGYLLERPRPAYHLFSRRETDLPSHCQYVKLGLIDAN